MANRNKLDYGETVRIKKEAPSTFRPGEVGEICGINTVGGATDYTVEFWDGSSKEIEEKYLEKI